MDKTIVGSFHYRSGAENAAYHFSSQGINMDLVSILSKDSAHKHYMPEFSGAFTGAAGLSGARSLFQEGGTHYMPGLGVVNALGYVSDQIVDDAPLAVSDSLADMGIPQENCQQFEEELRTGNIIITFRADEKSVKEVAHMMKQSGAHAIHVF